jgi:glycosyltransferase involved in cell wall biosynthesis
MSAVPHVSIVIPTFNCARYLPEAVASAQAEGGALELIVVDDGSTDETASVVERLGGDVIVLRQAHAGISAARNRGVAQARGEYLAFLDADDLVVPGRLALQVAHLTGAGAPDLSFGAVEEFVSPDLPADQQARFQPRGRMRGRVAGALLLRRETFVRVGPFDAAWRVGEFADWSMRAADAGLRAADLPDVVLRRRLHGSNIGVRQPEARVDFARIMKGALDRRRRSAGTDQA